MFQFPAFAFKPYVFRFKYLTRTLVIGRPAVTSRTTARVRKGGFPHSEILGSKSARNSPRLIAACHVLHRLYMPRHPLNALLTLDLEIDAHAR